MLDRVPSVVITSNHNELKLYQGNIVYLNDGDNFELRFFNPLQEKLGVEIMFNGIRKGDGYLVLNPGQDLILDRFLDEQRKMLFETYTINGNNKEAVEAIEKNGVISFNFYKEYYSNSNQQKNVNVNYDFPPKPTRYDNQISFNGTLNYSNGQSGPSGPSGEASRSGTSGTSGYKGIRGVLNSISTNNVTNISGNATFTSSNYSTLDGMDQMMFSSPSVFVTENETFDSLETGRIEKGDISDQRLKGINMNFASTPFHSMTYRLMPYSTMNREIGEIRQYCSCCGYRLRKSNWKFCPSCGEKIS
jgi:hypothetical protein